MTDETAKLIESLAAKFNTTTEHLWGVLLRQAPLSSAIELGLLVLWAIAFAFLTKRYVAFAKADDHDIDSDWVDGVIIAGGVVLTIGWLILCFALMCDSVEIVAGFFNPEYWALRQLLPHH